MIYLDEPNISGLERKAVFDALTDGHISTRSPLVDEFEQRMEDYLGCSCCATNSGTSALHLALIECGVGPGDEVILPALTFIATANVIKYVGAIPVFVDVDLETWNMDVSHLRRTINKNTKIIIPANIYGNPFIHHGLVNLELFDFLNGIYIVQDATESLGAKYCDIPIEQWGMISCLSFNGNKIITTGAGGLVCLNNPDQEYIKVFQRLSQQAIHDGIGYNYRMTGLSAALGLAQLDRLDHFLEMKKRFHQIYVEELGDKVTFQKECEHGQSNWWYTACLFEEDVEIERMQFVLKNLGVPTRRIFKPIPLMESYRDGKNYPIASYIYEHGLCLPVSTLNSEFDVRVAARTIRNLI